jgi:hypothetical protein
MNGDGELDPFTEALREDLPSPHDEARLRARLASAGVLAGAGVMTPATAAATGPTATVFAKLAALPLAVKVGATLALAGAAVVPLAHSHAPRERTPLEARARTVAPATRTAAPVTAVRAAEAPRRGEVTESAPPRMPASPVVPEKATSTAPEALPRVAAASAPGPTSTTRAPKRGGLEATRAGGVDSEPAPALTSSDAAMAAFPAAQAASERDEGTLRAETAVMERALAAMKQGDFGAARRELALHAARFPNGHLAPERDRALARIREKEMTP